MPDPNDAWDAERTARLEAEAWALEAMRRVPELLAEQHRMEVLVLDLCRANGELGMALAEAFALAADVDEHWPIGLTPPDVAAVHAEQRARAVECGMDPDRTPPEVVVPFDAVLAVARLVEWRRQARELVFRDESGTKPEGTA